MSELAEAPMDAATARRQARLSLVVSALVVTVGVAAVLGARKLDYWTSLGPGPGFFPTWLGVLLGACGLAWFIQTLLRLRPDPAPLDPMPAADAHESSPVVAVQVDENPPEFSGPTVVAIVVSLCVLAATLELLGYQLAMFLFVLFHLVVLGRRRLLLSLAIALVASVGVFVAFTRLLTVPLPASSIPFLRDMGF